MSDVTVVTGATGQIGLHLLDALVARGRRVRALVLPSDAALDHRRDIEVVRGDVRDFASLRCAFEGASSVHHLAAVVSTSSDPRPLLDEVNVVGAQNAARAAREVGVRRFVHFTSIVVFDPHPRDQVLDETRRRLTGPGYAPYTRTKVAGEQAVRDEVANGLDAVFVHPTVLIGPHEKHHAGLVRGLIEKHWAGQLPAAVTGGFDLVDVRDVVEGALLAEERGRRGESYILGGARYGVEDLLRVLERSCGRPAPRANVPIGVARAALPLVELASKLFGVEAPYDRESLFQLQYPVVSSAKAARELGYRPRPIEDAVRRVHAWLEAGEPPEAFLGPAADA